MRNLLLLRLWCLLVIQRRQRPPPPSPLATIPPAVVSRGRRRDRGAWGAKIEEQTLGAKKKRVIIAFVFVARGDDRDWYLAVCFQNRAAGVEVALSSPNVSHRRGFQHPRDYPITKTTLTFCFILLVCLFILFVTLILSPTSSTSRGHRYPSFSPRVVAFIFIAHRQRLRYMGGVTFAELCAYNIVSFGTVRFRNTRRYPGVVLCARCARSLQQHKNNKPGFE